MLVNRRLRSLKHAGCLLLISICSHASAEIEFGSVEYTTARMQIPDPFEVVLKRVEESLAPVDIARGYSAFQNGATQEQLLENSRSSNPDKRYYKVYEILWELPIFIDTGQRVKVKRFGIGGGPGRRFVGQYPAAGLHVVSDLNVYEADGGTVVEVLMPSAKYRAAFPDEPWRAVIAKQADDKMMAFLEGLKSTGRASRESNN